MHTRRTLLREIQNRLDIEKGTLYGHGSYSVALTYPSPYRVGMSSLGYQVIYGQFNEHQDVVCERAFLPDDLDAWKQSRVPLVTYESQRPVGDFNLIAFSLAYELELPGLMECLDLSGVPVLASERTERDPLVLIGGPLTFSNPVPSGPFADAIVMGEAEEAIHTFIEVHREQGTRRDTLEALAKIPGFYVPSIHGDTPPAVIAANNDCLPASSIILTPDTELSNMHLVEAERGCHRACTFCVMRRSTNGGMRLAGVEKVMNTIPDYAPKVGLVGAAVSDHPHLVDLVRSIVDSGRQVSLSSLRADRLTPELMKGLADGGYRTITVASDGASQRLRTMMMKRIREKHLIRAAELVKEFGLKRLKVYMIVGLPHETEEDLEELARFMNELSKICSVAMGTAPFVAKRNTPLDQQGFAGIKEVERRLRFLQKKLGRRIELRSTSARWAWIEYCLAQGDSRMGLAAMDAWKAGGSFAAWKKAIKKHGGAPVGTAPLPPIPKTREERLTLKRQEKPLVPLHSRKSKAQTRESTP